MSNRLIHETSPYLLQHAHNPVDWFPWGPEALQKAKDESKPILVSIGYSACHWCHVMERESFENQETAALMNARFINIKIDREERPDLDHVYMDAVQIISGSGGWPLNVFLTPDAKPFYGGTYFPPVMAYNRSSWRQVLAAIHQAWTDKPEEILSQAESLTNHLQHAGLFANLEKGDALFAATDLETITENLLKTADKGWGGFGNAPKFPQTFSIQFLLRQAYYLKKALVDNTVGQTLEWEPLVAQALLSLDKMIMGGIYDQLDGGFARYSTDARWLAPHFEKMLYDNALLITVISEAYQLTKKELYLDTINQTMAFISREWQDADGGFFSAYDADSEGEEGKFYTWEKAELEQLITDPGHFELFSAYYGIEADGSWEHTNILWVAQPLGAFCAARGLDEMETKKILSLCREILLDHRSKRIKPLLDDKKLMSWNALMITACCRAWCATGKGAYLTMAEKAAAFIEEKLKTDGNYHHNYKNGKAANPAFLEDFAFYIQALINLQECTGNMQYLETGIRLTHDTVSGFYDNDSDFFFFTNQNQKDIIFRKKDLYDGATPSGNSVMAQNLFYLGSLLDIQEWKQKAVLMIAQTKKMAVSYPGSFAIWGQLVQWMVYGLKEIAVVGSKYREMSGLILQNFIPDKVLLQSATAKEQYALLEGKEVPEKETLIFLCYGFSCQKPVCDVESFLILHNQVNF